LGMQDFAQISTLFALFRSNLINFAQQIFLHSLPNTYEAPFARI